MAINKINLFLKADNLKDVGFIELGFYYVFYRMIEGAN